MQFPEYTVVYHICAEAERMPVSPPADFLAVLTDGSYADVEGAVAFEVEFVPRQ